MKGIPGETDTRLEVPECRIADVKLVYQIGGRAFQRPQVSDFVVYLLWVGLHFVSQSQIQSEDGTRMPVVLNIRDENLVAHIVLVTRHKIGGQNYGMRLIRQKVDERSARGVDVAGPRPRAILSCLRGYQLCREVAGAVYIIDRDNVILLPQKSKTKLQTVIPAANESVVVHLENLVPEILVRRSPEFS